MTDIQHCQNHLACMTGALLILLGSAQAAQFTINGPTGSGEFGRTVTTLPNGNVVVTDPSSVGQPVTLLLPSVQYQVRRLMSR